MSAGAPILRWEWKVLLSAAEAERATAFARAHLAPDPYAVRGADLGYEVASTYLGPAPGPRAAERPSRLPSRYRVRRYGDDRCVWLERKGGEAGRVDKRRAPCDATAAEGGLSALPADHPGRAWAEEVQALGLVPQVVVSYLRAAWVLPASGARLTIDRALRARPAVRRVPESVEGGVPLRGPSGAEPCVLELKFDAAPPAAFERLLRQEGWAPRPWSKCGAALRTLRRAPLLARPRGPA